MYREKSGLSSKLIKYCTKYYKKSENYTRVLALGINEVDFDINLFGTHYASYGLKFVHISGVLDDKKNIIINNIEYDIDISYFMHYDNFMDSFSTFHITSLNGLNDLVNEEFEYLLHSNVYLDCNSEIPITVFADIEYIDFDLNLDFIDKIKTLYESNICLKGIFKLRLNTGKLLEKKFDTESYLNNLLDSIYYILIESSDFSDIVLDVRNYSKNNIFSAFQDKDEKVFLSNYIFDYVFTNFNKFIHPYNTNVRFLVNYLDDTRLDVIRDGLLSIKSINNLEFCMCDTYMDNNNFMIDVLDYIDIILKDKKYNRQKYQKINII